MSLLCVTLALVALDIITGVVAAAMHGELSSKVARQGLMHKSAYIACIALGFILDNAQTIIDMGLPFHIQELACYYICMCETLSIVENIAKINPELRGTPLLKLFVGTKHEELAEHKEDVS